MAVEDHPQFPEWERANQNLKDAKEAFKAGKATQHDVDKAQEEYDRAQRKIDND
jgi:outer membrane protein TolC